LVEVNSAGKFALGKDGYPASGEPVSASQKVIPYRPGGGVRPPQRVFGRLALEMKALKIATNSVVNR
jgi:hypothetical protein